MKKLRQCKACPWKVSTVPDKDIPGGYEIGKHENLRSTAAKPGIYEPTDALHLMACHESNVGAEFPCAGWMHNQLGAGNNLALRLAAARGCFGHFDLVLDGKQHEILEDTLPVRCVERRKKR